jgi:hypothetical protein
MATPAKTKKKPRRRPAPAKRPNGRPRFVPTAEQREKVELRKAMRVSDTDIALELGIARETLLEHFPQELRVGRLKKQGQSFDLLWKSAKDGNVTAQKAVVALMSTSTPTSEPDAQSSADAENVPVRQMAVGKKVAAKIAAQSAGEGTQWGNDLKPGFGKPN